MYELSGESAGQRLLELIDGGSRPASVSAELPAGPVTAVLLVWARLPNRAWAAGIAYLHRTWHERALVTMWVPAGCLRPHPGVDYRAVPRIRLPGDPAGWPALPPRYPHADADWLASHRHLTYGE